MRASLVLALVACSSARVPSPRFANTPAVTVVDDRRDVPVPPAKRVVGRLLQFYDSSFHRRATRALELPAPRRALGVNALDEVPDSTWFTNRIGVRALSPAEVRDGVATVGSPELSEPWTILGTKAGGTAVGFIIRDRRGVKHLLKLEGRGYPELETATDAIVSRILWAAGYNVPEDHVVYVHPSELELGPGATIEDVFGHKQPLDRATLEHRLAPCERDADGRMRGLASRFIEGKLLGGHPAEGRRPDDPNDRIPHERRRDLRGAYPLLAWLDHVDIKETNTLDTWIEERGRHYVKHYLLDFGKSLGAMTAISRDRRRGYAYSIDFGDMVRGLATAGLNERPWEDRQAPNIRGIGVFDATSFDPAAWRAETPGYVPFLIADAKDKLWGAKLVMRFTRAQLAAAIEAGRFTDPRAASYLLETLVARQRATGRHWFAQASPLDGFTVDAERLGFVDLMRAYALADTETTYVVARFDRDGHAFGSAFVLHPGAGGRTTFPLGLAREPDGYTIFEITTVRGGRRLAIYVHVARDAGGTPRVIGIWRP